MKQETKLATWIRGGGHSAFALLFDSSQVLEKKFSVVPDRIFESIVNDALKAAVERLNEFLPENTSINISSVDTSDLRAELAKVVADRLSEIGEPIVPDDPIIESALRHYAELLNGRFQRSGLGIEEYIW